MQFSKNMLFFYKIAPNCVKLILLISRNYHYASTSPHSFSLLSIDFILEKLMRVDLSKLNNKGDQSVDLV